MSVVKVQGNASGTGIFTIAAPNSNNSRTMTLADTNGTIYIAPGDGIQALASGVPTALTITAGTGVSVSNGDGVAGNPTITNSGVTSLTAGTNITLSASTGGVTISAAGGGVTSFNTRTGAVTLSSGDVTGALGYTPYNSTNPSGYITSSGVNTSTVLSATAGASYGGVGTYTSYDTGTSKSAGSNYTLGGLSGTWKCMGGGNTGQISGYNVWFYLFLRIS